MKRVYYDVETTGLSAKDEVIEFAAIVTDDSNNILELKDFYCYTTQPITRGAQEIHGIDKHTLSVRSKGKFFEEQFIPWATELGKDVVWFDWSNGGFDRRLINQTLTANGYKDGGDVAIMELSDNISMIYKIENWQPSSI